MLGNELMGSEDMTPYGQYIHPIEAEPAEVCCALPAGVLTAYALVFQTKIHFSAIFVAWDSSHIKQTQVKPSK